MKKLRILITAGPTIEPIDPVRFLSNHSTGKMGYALAKACVKHRHHVTLVTGPTILQAPKGCHVVPVKTAREMHKEVMKVFKETDLVFKVAAVADYRVKHKSSKKIKKTHDSLSIELTKNPDILKDLGKKKKPQQTLVGFAAETHRGVSYARQKLKEKNLDWIVLNEISKRNKGFGSDYNEVTLIANDGKKIKLPTKPKTEVAELILKTVLNIPLEEKNKFSFRHFNPVSIMKALREQL
ncbi:MAG: bifunctional phosphopantothenoylcysteine decarboxylase/phosphopantothenate--cysteine ligase CoaBC [Deltaproteobacteria bacterium]|nr:bifunctional phosphopantothenoylcysteine decarboxylase/phosphopantothenate--cysteine ligase CoaBC [Deltaproteobacteria bacterium]